MAVSFPIISGTTYPACLLALHASLGQPILHGCQLFIHLWDSLSCVAVTTCGAAYPEWLWVFQSSLGQPILHGCELFNHLWDSLSCMAVSFSIISGTA